jgi:hypothetical protein
MLKLDRTANAENKSIDIILIGVEFVLHILRIRCDGKIIIEYKSPVDLNHLGVVKLVFAVQICILIIGESIFIHVCCRIDDAAGQAQGIVIAEFKGVFVPNRQQVVPITAVDVLDVISQIGGPGC